jgi:hypothetical protein
VYQILYWAPHSEGFRGSGGIHPRMVNVSTRWRWVAALKPKTYLPQIKNYCAHCIRGWAGSRFSLRAVVNRSPCWETNPGSPALILVTILTELSRLKVAREWCVTDRINFTEANVRSMRKWLKEDVHKSWIRIIVQMLREKIKERQRKGTSQEANRLWW